MSKIVLITPTPVDISAFGVRALSAYLKREGHQTELIFLPGGTEQMKFNRNYVYSYDREIIDQIVDISKGADLIGVSFMSQYFDRAVQITNAIRKATHTPVIWGGIHPTVKPEQSLQYADMVCRHEGEGALQELLEKIDKGADYYSTKNIWFRKNGTIIKNDSRPYIQELDALPFVDFDLQGHYILDPLKNSIVAMDDQHLKRHLPHLPYFHHKFKVTYRTMTSRGCPHQCTYCASSALTTLRRRSVSHVISELMAIKKKYPFIEMINFFDDTFFAAPIGYFEEFKDAYKKSIGLPFYAQCSPTTLNEAKLSCLVDAGLIFNEMGIQTGSERTQKLYKRVVPNEKVLEAAQLLHRYGPKLLPPHYHIILDNPWESEEDLLDTLKLVLKLPRPFKFCIASLIFFPGTELYERAKREGLITDEIKEVYRKPFLYPRGTYLNYLIYLAGLQYVPRWILKLLSIKPLVLLFSHDWLTGFYERMYHLTEKIRLFEKGIVAVTTGDFKRIYRYVTRTK